LVFRVLMRATVAEYGRAVQIKLSLHLFRVFRSTWLTPRSRRPKLRAPRTRSLRVSWILSSLGTGRPFRPRGGSVGPRKTTRYPLRRRSRSPYKVSLRRSRARCQSPSTTRRWPRSTRQATKLGSMFFVPFSLPSGLVGRSCIHHPPLDQRMAPFYASHALPRSARTRSSPNPEAHGCEECRVPCSTFRGSWGVRTLYHHGSRDQDIRRDNDTRLGEHTTSADNGVKFWPNKLANKSPEMFEFTKDRDGMRDLFLS
jgi:hypothetical protein